VIYYRVSFYHSLLKYCAIQSHSPGTKNTCRVSEQPPSQMAPSGFSTKMCSFLNFSMRVTCLAHHPDNICWRIQNVKLFVHRLPTSCFFPSLKSEYSPQHRVLKYCQRSNFHIHTKMYPKVSGLAAWNENFKWYSSLPLGAVVSLFCGWVCEFCGHNPLCYFSTIAYYCKCIFRYRLGPETSGYTIEQKKKERTFSLSL
jgi:hypothetical protein